MTGTLGHCATTSTYRFAVAISKRTHFRPFRRSQTDFIGTTRRFEPNFYQQEKWTGPRGLPAPRMPVCGSRSGFLSHFWCLSTCALVITRGDVLLHSARSRKKPFECNHCAWTAMYVQATLSHLVYRHCYHRRPRRTGPARSDVGASRCRARRRTHAHT